MRSDIVPRMPCTIAGYLKVWILPGCYPVGSLESKAVWIGSGLRFI